MYKVDLNSDLGESFGAYTIGSDDRVLALVSSANVACGFHAGDPSVMGATVAACRAQGVAVGAHPGFPDLVGFGRRQLAVTPDQAYGDVLYQIGALAGFCRANGALLQHVKPHGALYNMACKDLELARAVTRAVRDFAPALVLLAPAGSCLQQAAKEQGVSFGCEVFADRAYEADGSLRVVFPRTAGVPAEFDQIRKIILDILPCHLEVEFYFRYLTWAECEAAEYTWDEVETAQHTWESFQLAVPPEE